jgi:hypothetical protein
MNKPDAPEPQGIRQLSFSDLELDWFKMPWLNVADRDRPFVKRAVVDLDPLGGPVSTVTIELGDLERGYIVITDVDIVAADPFSVRSTEVLQRTDIRPGQFYGRTPLNHWRQFDRTASPNPMNEAEFAVNRLFTVQPGQVYQMFFNNLSPFGRAKFDVEVRGFLSRIVN